MQKYLCGTDSAVEPVACDLWNSLHWTTSPMQCFLSAWLWGQMTGPSVWIWRQLLSVWFWHPPSEYGLCSSQRPWPVWPTQIRQDSNSIQELDILIAVRAAGILLTAMAISQHAISEDFISKLRIDDVGLKVLYTCTKLPSLLRAVLQMVGIPKNAQLFINDIQHLLMIYTRYMSYQTTTVNKVWVITTMKWSWILMTWVCVSFASACAVHNSVSFRLVKKTM